MHISEFDYELPAELIAQEPLAERDASRMLVLDRKSGSCADSQFSELPHYIKPNEVLVINNTRVFLARLSAERDPSGGRVEVLLVREIEPLLWEALLRPAQRVKQGARLRFHDSRLRAEVIDPHGESLRVLRFECDGSFDLVLEELGQTPLPPYINRPRGATPQDRERYQTIFARSPGAIAAPTAGLHFSRHIMNQLRDRGAKIVEITLHVGYGTFEPVRVEQVEAHRVAAERFEISATAAAIINEARARGNRVIAVGTTTTRALESAANPGGQVEACKGFADLTISPGYVFSVVDALITNFHLPRSSLLMLVCALAESESVLAAYRHAVAARYRFYSYGDCMLIV